MQVRTRLALALAVASVGLSANAFGQQSYQIQAGVSFPASPGLPSTDDNGPNQTGNAVDYTSVLIQTYTAPSVVDVPNGAYQGAGSPYIIGTLGYVIGTSAHSSAGSSTAFYLNPTTDQFVMFGQYSATSSQNYQDNYGYTNYNGITNQPENYHTALLSGENASGQVIGYQSIEAPDSSNTGVLGRHAYEYSIPTNSYVSLGLTQPDSYGAVFANPFTYTNVSSVVVNATYAFSTSIGIDNSGDACGTSNRYYNWGVAQSSGTTGGL